MHMRTKLLVLGIGTALALSACGDREDRRTDAGEARDLADASQDGSRGMGAAGSGAQAPTGIPAGTQDRAAQPGFGDGNVVLSMSGTGSSHLIDGAGSSVYVLEGNTDGSRCDAACEEAWPPVLTDDALPRGAAGVEQGRIGTLDRGNRTHVTYGGQPLYRYAGDGGANRTAGDGVQDQWGTWSLVGLDGGSVSAGGGTGDAATGNGGAMDAGGQPREGGDQ